MKRQRHWERGWNRYRKIRLVLSTTPDEAALVRALAAERGETVQGLLMSLVTRAAARSRRKALP